MKSSHSLVIVTMIFMVLACVCQKNNGDQVEPRRNITREPIDASTVKPIFKIQQIIGKNEKEVDRVLGKATDSWTMRSDPTRLMREYTIGQSLSIIFYKNRPETLTFFFSTPVKNSATAFKLCGIDFDNREPNRVFDAGGTKSEQFDNYKIGGFSSNIVFLGDSIKFDFR